MPEPVNNITAIRRYFSAPGTSGHPDDYKAPTTGELALLTKEERGELGSLAAKELGLEIAGV